MILRDTLMPLNNKIQQDRRASIQTPERATTSVREHKEILAAINAGDEEQAVAGIRRHIVNAIQRALGEEGK
jgi:DNA-binding GntR family transcriptional regulator